MVATIPVVVDAFLIVLAIPAVVVRFFSRKLSGAKLWYDDWLCVAALVRTSREVQTYHADDVYSLSVSQLTCPSG